jgi:hypothetical protein
LKFALEKRHQNGKSAHIAVACLLDHGPRDGAHLLLTRLRHKRLAHRRRLPRKRIARTSFVPFTETTFAVPPGVGFALIGLARVWLLRIVFRLGRLILRARHGWSPGMLGISPLSQRDERWEMGF